MAAAKKKATEPKRIGEGDKAPRFRLQDHDGKGFSAKDLDGAPYVLYFYPRADTPGCTKETCGFQEALPAFGKVGVTVVGVSPDAPEKQARFREKYGIAFRLLCDTDHALAEKYGCWVEKNMYGKTSFGIERSTFLVDAEGRIRKAWRKVKVDGHVEEVAAEAAKLS